MVDGLHARLDPAFAALADGTRRAILEKLMAGPLSVTELARPFAVSIQAVSKHVKILVKAGLVRQEVVGRVRRCHLSAAPLRPAVDWLAQYRVFWEESLDSLASYLDQPDSDANGAPS
ncbi:MAG: ArsR family transcriptional regulator [Phycisphaerales bacterium]|nr:MAG: ArsR family transcriptional regulator [Phycisphaerales bacterium]